MVEFEKSDLLVHMPTGIKGYYLKSYYPTVSARILQITTFDGRIFYAPYRDFKKCN